MANEMAHTTNDFFSALPVVERSITEALYVGVPAPDETFGGTKISTTLNKSHFHQIAEQGGKFRIKCYLFWKKMKSAGKMLRRSFHKQFARVLCIINFVFLPFLSLRFISIDSRWGALSGTLRRALCNCVWKLHSSGGNMLMEEEADPYCYCFMWIEKSQNALNGEQCWQYIKKSFWLVEWKMKEEAWRKKLWNSNFSLRRIGEEDSRRHVKPDKNDYRRSEELLSVLCTKALFSLYQDTIFYFIDPLRSRFPHSIASLFNGMWRNIQRHPDE